MLEQFRGIEIAGEAKTARDQGLIHHIRGRDQNRISGRNRVFDLADLASRDQQFDTGLRRSVVKKTVPESQIEKRVLPLLHSRWDRVRKQFPSFRVAALDDRRLSRAVVDDEHDDTVAFDANGQGQDSVTMTLRNIDHCHEVRVGSDGHPGCKQSLARVTPRIAILQMVPDGFGRFLEGPTGRQQGRLRSDDHSAFQHGYACREVVDYRSTSKIGFVQEEPGEGVTMYEKHHRMKASLLEA